MSTINNNKSAQTELARLGISEEQVQFLKAQADEALSYRNQSEDELEVAGADYSGNISNWRSQPAPRIGSRMNLVSQPNIRTGSSKDANPADLNAVIPNGIGVRPSQEVAARLGLQAQLEAKAQLEALEAEEQRRQILDISNIETRLSYVERKLKQFDKKLKDVGATAV